MNLMVAVLIQCLYTESANTNRELPKWEYYPGGGETSNAGAYDGDFHRESIRQAAVWPKDSK